MGLFTSNKPKEPSLENAVEKSRRSILSKLSKAVLGKSKVDIGFLDELEEILISSDVGVPTTVKIIDRLEKRVAKEKYFQTTEIQDILTRELIEMLEENKKNKSMEPTPLVIMVVGVNGVGKTTTIGKLAHKFGQEGKKVLLGAGDTFRAAAVDQISSWSNKTGAQLVSKGMNTDPAAVAYETIKKGKEENFDVIIVDTAGRLHTKINLMNELSKIKRVMAKIIPEAPHEVLLVLDGSTGQNAFEQAKQFTNATQVTGLVVTKLDGSAKGGVLIGISDQFEIPIKYVGTGEKMEDLQIFNEQKFVETLFK
ncbi:MAG: signal recognition particle-docking protein FtsY [Bacteroidota bacterium]|nr:signal recognition particle-docking protein FtsY [Bacteroidota bacterium]